MSKSNLKSLIFFLSISLFIFSGCKKYEDGPLISFKSKVNRLEGEWRIVYLNGDDVFSNYPRIYFKFDKDGNFFRTEKGEDYSHTDQGTWVWESHKEIIEVDLIYTNYRERIDFRVSKLTSGELWIEDNHINDYKFQKE